MPKYTKAQVDAAIATIVDNVSKSNTPAIVRAVLAVLKDMEQLASYIKFINPTLNSTTTEEALTALASANIPVWNASLPYKAGYTVYWQYLMYVANIDIVAGGSNPASSSNWILVSDSYTSDSQLNYKGKYDMAQYSELGILFPVVHKGDFFIANGIAGTFAVQDLDWVIALVDDAIFEAEYQTNQWMIIPFSTYANALSISQIVNALNALTSTNRIIKNAVRGADFCLNRRGRGDIYDGDYRSGMINILKGDFWIYHLLEPAPPADGQTVAEGDWVVAMTDNAVPSLANYEDAAKWWIIHFSESTRVNPVISLSHYRLSPTSESETLLISNVLANIFSITINKLTYYGKYDDGSFGQYDFVYRFVGNNTQISINPDVLASFETGMVIDVIYTTE